MQGDSLMADPEEKLTPATPEELAFALEFALRFDGKKRFRQSGEPMARISAEHIARHLESSFVIVKRPPKVRTSDQHPRPRDRETWS
jgi:hypothetical protein